MQGPRKGRLVQAKPGIPVGSLVARGEVELGFQQLSEIIHVEGIELLGTMPAPVQIVTVFSGAVCQTARDPAAARAATAALHPLGHMGEPDDIAWGAVYLASDEAAWVTGQTIQINGGSITT